MSDAAEPIEVVQALTKAPSFLKLIWYLKDNKIKDIVPNNAEITWLDSLTTDGTGVEIKIDFKKVAYCSDAILRKGILTLKTLDTKTFMASDSILLETGVNDSFAVRSEQGWYYLFGKISLIQTDLNTFKVSNNLTYSNEIRQNGNYIFDFQLLKEALGFNIPFSIDNYRISNGTATFNLTNDTKFTTVCENNFFAAGCYYGFLSGGMTLTSGSKKAEISFDPFSNGACDKIAKIKIKSRETVFNYW